MPRIVDLSLNVKTDTMDVTMGGYGVIDKVVTGRTIFADVRLLFTEEEFAVMYTQERERGGNPMLNLESMIKAAFESRSVQVAFAEEIKKTGRLIGGEV